MKFAVAVLALLNAVEARSAWSTIKGTKDQLSKKGAKNHDNNRLSLSYYTIMDKRNATATEVTNMLRGTLSLKFADDEAVPEDGNAVRICMSFRNPLPYAAKAKEGVASDLWKNNEWESVGFQLTDWFDKSKWLTRFKSKNTTPDRWCSYSMDKDNYSTKNYDSQWEKTAQYWNEKERTLLVDFQRPMDVKGDETINFNKFTEGDGSEESDMSLDFMLNYGVYSDSTQTTKKAKSFKNVAGKRVEVKAVVGPMGDKPTAAYGKEGATNYRAPAY